MFYGKNLFNPKITTKTRLCKVGNKNTGLKFNTGLVPIGFWTIRPWEIILGLSTQATTGTHLYRRSHKWEIHSLKEISTPGNYPQGIHARNATTGIW